MAYSEIFVSPSNVFAGIQKTFEKARYVTLGVPFDATSTHRSGARFGPDVIRRASLNIEPYSFRTGIDIEGLPIHDLGDLHISMDTYKTLERLELVIKDLLEAGKTPIVIGGEHTITMGILKGLRDRISKTAIVSFDAHLDLRDEFLGLKLSHTTFMRRISEQVKPSKIIEVGTRAVCQEELNYTKSADIEFFTSHQIREKGPKQIVGHLRDRLSPFDNIYLSVDIDVLDPAYVPAVQNPEPEGLETHVLLDILFGICDNRVVGFDLAEFAPCCGSSTSAVQAARIVFEVLCYLERSLKI